MKHVIDTLYNWFWWENFWMPANCSWADFQDRHDFVAPKPHQLFAIFPYAVAMLGIRFLVERFIAAPLANSFGIKNVERIKPLPHPILERFFKERTKKPSQLEISKLAKKCNWSVHLVEKWFRRRRNLEIPTLYKKFQESCFRHILLHPWRNPQYFAVPRNNQLSFSLQSVLPSQYWYYMLEMSFYLSLLFTLGTDTKRKDFRAHVVHHLAALALMFSSWSANYIRLGTLVMLVHDIADVPLEAAKLFNYARWEKTCSALFVTFAITFFISRFIFFPFCTTVVMAYFVFNGQLLILQALHIYWGYFVFQILKKFIFLKVRGPNFQPNARKAYWPMSLDNGGNCFKTLSVCRLNYEVDLNQKVEF
uniref:Ceramide synthase 3 n=1 Tax=Salvator merianae TaxID=96440 RepID=A0A8D0EBG7_SALMN